MIEVEVKARITRPEEMKRVQAFISHWNPLPMEFHEDRYFDHPCRNFSKSDEALRLRRIGSAHYLTYKGPKLDLVSKTREEIEIKTSPAIKALLEHLGFAEAACVLKRRSAFRKGDILLCLDEVEGLGSFVEMESLSHEKKATKDLLGILESLGLESETRSYLELMLEAA